MRSAFLTLHNSWLFLLFLSLVILITTAWHAPMSGDEYVHKVQAEKNIRYLKSLGQDKEALDTPISRLKHYGQSFDTLTVWLAESWNIDNVYRFRHVCNAIVAWLVIVFTSLTALFVTKNKLAAIMAVLLMLVTARFMGHAMNNLKDVPFALSFIFSVYFTLKFIDRLPRLTWRYFIFIVLGTAFGISIRIGGMLIAAYFILFCLLQLYYLYTAETVSGKTFLRSLIHITGLSFLLIVCAYLLAILCWPWALEKPLKNPLESMQLMNHYPTTVRQVFEGKLYWSDQFPWYYLSKHLLITLPLISLLGFLAFLGLFFSIKLQGTKVLGMLLLLAFGFPLFYAAATGANVYGGWRQMLFVLPMFTVLAAIGLWVFYEKIKHKKPMVMVAVLVGFLMLFHPLRHIIVNYPYQYIYFNELVGGVKGAFGNYELDYYFTSYRNAYRFVDEQNTVKVVAANFIIPEYYENKSYLPALIDYYDRSATTWDYAIIANTFLNPYQLKHGYWPPQNTVYEEKVDGVPILAVIKRATTDDLDGITFMENGQYFQAVELLKKALVVDSLNESILLYLARAQVKSGDIPGALTTLQQLESIYPDNEWAIDLKGEIAFAMEKYDDAEKLFQKNIDNNHRFHHSYLNLANLKLHEGDTTQSTRILKECLRLNPFYAPAYHLYGKILVAQGEESLGRKMLEYSIEGPGKYGKK
ncbi:MAG: tetratricopeptide repeat protein [Cyclobacteriaceae bacterium]|nr:tetratricopeptide repeat protein [Cyclobacteriaceae bacterium]